MFSELKWYWWLIIAAAISIPFKLRFMKWRSGRREERKTNSRDKWGDE